MASLAKPPRVIVFADKNGKEPFTQWLYGLKDVMGRKRILIRITRLEHGNFGDCESVGEGCQRITNVLWGWLSGLFRGRR